MKLALLALFALCSASAENSTLPYSTLFNVSDYESSGSNSTGAGDFYFDDSLPSDEGFDELFGGFDNSTATPPEEEDDHPENKSKMVLIGLITCFVCMCIGCGLFILRKQCEKELMRNPDTLELVDWSGEDMPDDQ